MTTTTATLPDVLRSLRVYVTLTPGDLHRGGCPTAPGWDHYHHRATVHRTTDAGPVVVLGPLDWHAGTGVRPNPHPRTGRVTPEEAADVLYGVWLDVETLAGDDPDGVGMMIDARREAGQLASEGDLRDVLAIIEQTRDLARRLDNAFTPAELEQIAEGVREW